MVRIALAQVNPTVGDLDGNRLIIQEAIEQAKVAGASLVALPELVITGYPPEDLLLKGSFVEDNLAVLGEVAASTSGIAAVVGFVDSDADPPKSNGKRLYNAAAVIADGQVCGVYHKHHLPNYGVFDERRYFQPGEGLLLGETGDLIFGVTICEDLWKAEGPHAAAAAAGARLIVNINGSPYHMRKGAERHALIRNRAVKHDVAIAYVNTVGGQDELVFDGQSLVFSSRGELLARAAQFEEEILLVDLDQHAATKPGERTPSEEGLVLVKLPAPPKPVPNADAGAPRMAPELGEEAEVWAALVLGVRDYLRKNRFERAIVGISGGVDSALTAALAAEALGPEGVLGVFNPSEHTSMQSYEDAEALAKNLGIQMVTLPIDDAYQSMRKTLDPIFGDGGFGGVAAARRYDLGTPEAADPLKKTDVAEENLQSRVRGNLWMAITNKFGGIVLSTGNKSEMAVGYATLYGDMSGGFAVLKDVPKTLVYRLARWRNAQPGGEVIPERIIERAPTAELRAGQLDTDSLPPYEILDPILEAYIEGDRSPEEMIARGFDAETVHRVVEMVDQAEYKRRQTPPGIKITQRAFGRDRRLPITNRYRPRGAGANPADQL